MAKNKQQQTDKIRNQVARMLITNNVVFFLLHGPYHVMNVIDISEEHLGYDLINSYASDVMFWVGRVAAVANSAVNPIIYNVTNPRYRQAFTKCFWCNSKAGNPRHLKNRISIEGFFALRNKISFKSTDPASKSHIIAPRLDF